jgi:hypothetical protein
MRKQTVVAFVIFSAICQASDLTLQGKFTADDDVQLFSVSVAAPATVDIRSYGYAGGTTSTGTVVLRGGFDTIRKLFSASGAFLSENDDGARVATDPSTGLTGGARITTSLAAGNYLLTLTEYDNFASGNLTDGFHDNEANWAARHRRALLFIDLDRNISTVSRAGARKPYDHSRRTA